MRYLTQVGDILKPGTKKADLTMSSVDFESESLSKEPPTPTSELASSAISADLIPLLEPIAGPAPCGPDMFRNEFDVKIREIKRDSSSPQRAIEDILKYASGFLGEKSKDLRVAAELAAQLGTKQGLRGMMIGLELMLALTEKFWDDIHRLGELDEPPSTRYELRAGAFQRLDSSENMPKIVLQHVFAGKLSLDNKLRAEILDKNISQTRGDKNTSDKESKINEYLEDAKKRGDLTLEELTSEQNLVAEKFLGALRSQLSEVRSISTRIREIDSCLARPERFNRKYGFFPNTLTKLGDLEDWINGLIRSQPEEEEVSEAEEPVVETAEEQDSTANELPVSKPTRRVSPVAPLTDLESARARIVEAATFWRGENPEDPTPYLLLRVMRMGEAFLCDSGAPPAPNKEERQALKRGLEAEDWTEVSRCVEAVMATPAGRGWLDIHRAGIRALDQLERPAAASALRALLTGWLGAQPGWPTIALDDDTPAAGDETRRFMAELMPGTGPASVVEPPSPLPILPYDAEASSAVSSIENKIEALVSSGQRRVAIARLAVEARAAQTRRDSFLFRLRQAELCHEEGHSAVAHTILDDLARQIELHKLEIWEAPELSARVLATLYLSGRDPVLARAAYQRLCQLDVDTALTLGPPPE